MMKKLLTGLGILMVSGVFFGCGEDANTRRFRTAAKTLPGFDTTDPTVPPSPDQRADGWKVRGRWEMAIEARSQKSGRPQNWRMLSSANANQSMNASVAANVNVDVSNANFATPGQFEDVESYGSLDITSLRDNALRVCGVGGNEKCTVAAIRLYTSGTPTGGLYSATEDYGLPISTTGGATVGLGAAGAAITSQFAIGANKHVMHLNDFTNAAPLVVPVAVDFTDAAASSYTATLVLEYVTQ